MVFAYYLHDEKSIEEFEQTLLWFKRRYNLISYDQLREYVKGNLSFNNACMLSVDDGWRSTYEVIFPVMKQYNVPFTIFVSPEICIQKKNFWYYTYHYLNQEEIKKVIVCRKHFGLEVCKYDADMILKELPIDEVYDILNEVRQAHPEIEIPRGFVNTCELLNMKDSGLVEIGAHTLAHPILANETQQRVKSEINGSISDLSALIGKEVRTFAYPNGIGGLDYGQREMDILKNGGVELAFSVDPDCITPKSNPLSLPRWGSMARLKFGRWGKYLPSRMNQAAIRSEIKKYRL